KRRDADSRKPVPTEHEADASDSQRGYRENTAISDPGSGGTRLIIGKGADSWFRALDSLHPSLLLLSTFDKPDYLTQAFRGSERCRAANRKISSFHPSAWRPPSRQPCARAELQCSAKAAKDPQPQYQGVGEYGCGKERQAQPHRIETQERNTLQHRDRNGACR